MSRTRPLILYVVTLAEVGGAQSYVRDLASGAVDEFEVAVAAHGEGPLRTAVQELDIPFFPLNHVRRAISLWRDPLGFLELIRLFRRVRPDVVHLNSSKAGILGRMAAVFARVPVRVFTAHGWAFNGAAGPESRLYLWADRAVRPLATMIVCVCEDDRRTGLRAGVCTAERSIVIRNAVDVGPPPVRAREEPDHVPVRIVSVGRLAAQKNFSTLIEAIALLPAGAAHLRVLGDGPLRGALEAEIRSGGLEGSVDLVGEVGDVKSYLRDSDIFALSSLWEGMPLSILEAMAVGLPVVASAVNGVDEVVVDGETGFLTPPGDSAALAARLAQLVDDPSLRSALGAAGRTRAEELFSLPPWREAHFSLYRSLLGARA